MSPIGYRYLAKSIDDLLWYTWDPIGINNRDWAGDEYIDYAVRVREMVVSQASIDDIFAYLRSVETTHMGLHDADAQRTRIVAQRAIILGEWARGLL
jgi:hypothetical protein